MEVVPFTTLRTFSNQAPEQDVPPGDSDFVALSGDSIEISTKNLVLTGASGDIGLRLWRSLDSEKQVIAVLFDGLYGDNRLILPGLGGTSPSYCVQFAAPLNSGARLSGVVLARAIASSSQDAISGSNGATLVTGTANQTGNWSAIEFLADTQFTSITSNWDGAALTSVTWGEGKIISGRFTQFQLASGSVAAYKV